MSGLNRISAIQNCVSSPTSVGTRPMFCNNRGGGSSYFHFSSVTTFCYSQSKSIYSIRISTVNTGDVKLEGIKYIQIIRVTPNAS